jgi:Cu(I)/Ag(I) efflux system membrane protein CusA/SilA
LVRGQRADLPVERARLIRVASLVKGTQEAVGGGVVARTGVNTKLVIDAVKARIAQIAPGLPQGVTIVPFYDRSDLIEQAVGTLRTALIEEIALVTLAHVIFLMHFRSILIVTLPLPLAVLMSFLGMYYAGISSNIMSLAGIAIAIGVLVDAGIVVAPPRATASALATAARFKCCWGRSSRRLARSLLKNEWS